MARGRELAAARAQTRAPSALQLVPSGRSLLVGFAVLGGAALLYLGARSSSVFAVRSLAVATEPAGHSRAVERELRPLTGRSLLAVDGDAIAKRLDRLPHVHLLGYDRSFPNTLRVHVSVERPVAVLRRADENWLVSSEGRVLRRADTRLRRPLPVVWIPRVAEPEVGAIVRAAETVDAVRALAAMRTAAPNFYRRIWYVAPREQGLTIVLRDQVEVRLGDHADVQLKLEVARRVLRAIAETGSEAAYVDVAVPTRPVAGETLDSQVEG